MSELAVLAEPAVFAVRNRSIALDIPDCHMVRSLLLVRGVCGPLPRIAGADPGGRGMGSILKGLLTNTGKNEALLTVSSFCSCGALNALANTSINFRKLRLSRCLEINHAVNLEKPDPPRPIIFHFLRYTHFHWSVFKDQSYDWLRLARKVKL